MLRTLVAGGYPADAYAWGEFRSRAPRREEGDLHEGAPRGGGEADLGEEGLKGAVILVYDAIEGRYASTAPRVGLPGGGVGAGAAAAAAAVRRLDLAFDDMQTD